jgi:hypothetical protein
MHHARKNKKIKKVVFGKKLLKIFYKGMLFTPSTIKIAYILSIGFTFSRAIVFFDVLTVTESRDTINQ